MEQENKNKKSLDKKLIVGIVIVAVIVFAYVAKVIMTGNAVKIQEEQEAYYDKLVENCECLEHERIFCMEGFELSEHEEFCQGDGKVTGVRKGCSQFNCHGDKVYWKSETKLWEPVLEFENE